MNCDQTDELLLEYLYGELSPEEARSFKAHLEECPDCAAKAAELARVRDLAAELPEEEPPGLVTSRVLAEARAEAEKQTRFWGRGWLKVLVPLCLMAVAGGVVLFQLKTGLVPKDLYLASAPEEPAPVTAGKTSDLLEEEAARKTQPRIASEEERRESGAEPQPAARTRPEAAAGREALAREKEEAAGGAAGPPAPPSAARVAESGAGRPTAGLGTLEAEPKMRADVRKPNRPVPEEEKTQALKEARAALKARAYTRAVRLYAALLEKLPPGHPDRPQALLGLARAYEGSGQLKSARRTYLTLAAESPPHRDLARQKALDLSRP